MAELFCNESEPKKGYLDRVIFYDDRVLDTLLKQEEHYSVTSNYMEFQTDIKPYMRKVVSQWMLEVCNEQEREEEVFPLALNLMDRFLSSCSSLRRGRLQLLASSCMFIASKLKETYPLPPHTLVKYTDDSITLDELLDFEMLVLCKLRWDIASITPNEFVDLLLVRLGLSLALQERVRVYAVRYLCVCLKEMEFVLFPPSLLASACICSALTRVLQVSNSTSHMPGHMTGHMMYLGSTTLCHSQIADCSRRIHRITGVDLDMLRSCYEQVHELTTREEEREEEKAREQAATAAQKEPAVHPGTPTDTLSVPIE